MSAIDALVEVARHASKARSALQRAKYLQPANERLAHEDAARAHLLLAQQHLEDAVRTLRHAPGEEGF